MVESGHNLPKSREIVPKITKVTRVAAAALALTVAAAARPAAAEESSKNQKIAAAYLETDLSTASYSSIANKLDLHKLNRLVLAFDTADSHGEVSEMKISPPVNKIVSQMEDTSDLMVAIGGEAASPSGWNAALNHPDAFVSSTNRAIKSIERQTGRRVDGVDIDFEFPKAAQADRLVSLIKKLRHGIPGEKITMAIPPTDYNRAGFDFEKLTPLVDDYNVMAYEYHGPWETSAGDIASGIDVIHSLKATLQEVGSQTKLVVGFPGYGYIYHTAKRRHDKFSGDATIAYNQIPAGAVKDDKKLLASEALIKGDWTSVESPAMIHQTYKELLKRYPNLAGAFYWQLPDLNQDHISAISQ